jgi:hypothetical protein
MTSPINNTKKWKKERKKTYMVVVKRMMTTRQKMEYEVGAQSKILK